MPLVMLRAAGLTDLTSFRIRCILSKTFPQEGSQRSLNCRGMPHWTLEEEKSGMLPAGEEFGSFSPEIEAALKALRIEPSVLTPSAIGEEGAAFRRCFLAEGFH